jgi:hypothetical protein
MFYDDDYYYYYYYYHRNYIIYIYIYTLCMNASSFLLFLMLWFCNQFRQTPRLLNYMLRLLTDR